MPARVMAKQRVEVNRELKKVSYGQPKRNVFLLKLKNENAIKEIKKMVIDYTDPESKYPQNQVSRIIEELLEETKKSLIKGEEVRLQGYFTLKTTMTTPRLAMNLQTGKKMKVPAKRVPKCKFSLELLDRNSNNYLILELDNGESIFVFSEGQAINFTVEEGNNGTNLLVDYEIEAEMN
ncbi:5926_t:CDS:2 [Ambispora gerdemannii]|uniref:5926_t:CDS:1 n=1 Tax=Ambispora gerdemannii TaxID=144530 RepID=A0A9N8UXC8_9GLOM|nr:5926_t:CDS:2 [Ambispora gerdemannii]